MLLVGGFAVWQSQSDPISQLDTNATPSNNVTDSSSIESVDDLKAAIETIDKLKSQDDSQLKKLDTYVTEQ